MIKICGLRCYRNKYLNQFYLIKIEPSKILRIIYKKTMTSITKQIEVNYNEIKEWALKKPEQFNCKEGNIKEKLWGNNIICDKNNNQWTTSLGEYLVHYVLTIKNGKPPRRAKKKNNYCPDWETDDAIYEVKTRNWTTSGTAGEKVYGTALKYAEINELYSKPLIIVCVAYQEYELTFGKTPILGENIRPAHKKILDFYKNEFNTTYIGFSQLINNS
jgi:hypothetical protein